MGDIQEIPKGKIQEIPKGKITDRLQISEELFSDTVEIRTGKHNRGQSLDIIYGPEKTIASFDISNGQRLKMGDSRLQYSYIPIILSGCLTGGLIYICRKNGGCLLTQMLMFDRNDEDYVLVSPSGESEACFRNRVQERITPEEALDTEGVSIDAILKERLLMEADCINDGISDPLVKACIAHRYISDACRGRAEEIPEIVTFLFRALGIPCLTVSGFSSFMAAGGRDLKPGEDYKPNNRWNMVFINGKWRFLDTALDMRLSRDRAPAVNGFLASPEWFGITHFSMAVEKYNCTKLASY